jgi:hypothetical protein
MEPTDDSALILKALQQSKERGTIIGLWAKPLGNGMFMCRISSIEECEHIAESVISLKPYDASGVRLRTDKLKLNEIERVYAFSFRMKN